MGSLTLEPRGISDAPWGVYGAYVDVVQVGECAFKAPPLDGRVEIAYHTFDEFRGLGYATAMARHPEDGDGWEWQLPPR